MNFIVCYECGMQYFGLKRRLKQCIGSNTSDLIMITTQDWSNVSVVIFDPPNDTLHVTS